MRKKTTFSDEINFRISQLVEANKSVREIKEDLSNNFNFNINEETLRLQIKSLGYKTDCRKTKQKTKPKNSFDFTIEHKSFIQMMSEGGMSLDEMHDLLKKEYGVEVSRTTINNLINKERYIRGEKYNSNWDNSESFGDENEIEYKEKDITQVKKTISNDTKYDGWVDKMREDPQFRRYCHYCQKEPYNYEGNGDREGMKDTWFTRDGFIKINTSQNIYAKKDGYEMMGGSYRSQFELEDDLKFYTFVFNKDSRGEQVFKKRKEIKKWYEEHRPRINELYDFIVAHNYASTINEINEFNEICRELYNKKIEFLKVLVQENPKYRSTVKGVLGYMSKDLQFVDFRNHMINLGLFANVV